MSGNDSPVSRRRMLKAGGLAMATGLAGCSGGPGPGSSDGGDGDGGDGGGSTTTTATTQGTPSKPEKITVRAWGGAWQESLDQYVSQPFTEETGIAVEYDNTSDAKMQGKIRTAINQDREPPVNVQWSTTPLSYRAFTSDLTAPVDPEVAPNIETLLPAAKPDTDVEWPLVGLYSYAYPLSYRTDEFDSPPTSWGDLWGDQFESSVGLYSRGDGFTPIVAQLTDATLPDQMDPVWEKYRALKPNVAMIGLDSKLTQGLRTGEISAVCMLTANTYTLKNDGAKVDWTVPEEGAVAKTDAMWTPKNQSDGHRYWAQKYIDVAASASAQVPWADGLGVAPLNGEAEVPDYMQGDPAFPTSESDFEQLIQLDPKVYVEYGPEWESEFKKIFA